VSEADADVAMRVLVLAPTARDAEVSRSLLAHAGVPCAVCRGVSDLARAVGDGAGAILTTDEALAGDAVNELLAVLALQPDWSELPVVLLTRGGDESPVATRVLKALGNVTLLDRPAPMRSVVSAVQAGVRGRVRQYQLRDQVEMIRRSEAAAQAARAEAEHAGRMKDEFLATLSHELRTPLNAILGWAQVLRQVGGDPAEIQHATEIIERNARLQAQLIEDLLDMSRIISGKIRLDLQPVDPAAVVDAALETVRPAADAKGIRLVRRAAAGDPVAADAARLQQVLWNLLSNAVKFTPAGGTVTVELRRRPGVVEVAVTDTGEGLNPQFVPHVFERFRQADASMGRRHGGLGLGLAIVKQLVELHGGTVAAASAGEGRGATFTVRLPVSLHHAEPIEPAAPQKRAAPARQALPDLAGVAVLVVDDDADARELVKRVLCQYHAQVTTAASAREALDLLSGWRPDVLVSDIAMPGMDGYELMQRVRAAEVNGDSLAAAALTAFAGAEDRRRSLEAGFRSHVSKPVEPAELVQTVAALAGREAAPVPPAAGISDS
jgi:signal transduction histidine kinase/CheY-like chemotaxis protein